MRIAFILLLSFASAFAAVDENRRPTGFPAISSPPDLDLTQDFGIPEPPVPVPQVAAPSRAWIYWGTAGLLALGGLGGLGWYWLESRPAEPVIIREEQVFTDGE